MPNVASRALHKVLRDHGTNDPFIIAENLGIEIAYAPFSELGGTFVNVFNTPMIIINQEYEYTPHAKFVAAHELFHAMQHDGTLAFYHKAINVTGKKEREANRFATYLCLVEATIYEGQSTYDTLRENYIPQEMEEFL